MGEATAEMPILETPPKEDNPIKKEAKILPSPETTPVFPKTPENPVHTEQQTETRVESREKYPDNVKDLFPQIPQEFTPKPPSILQSAKNALLTSNVGIVIQTAAEVTGAGLVLLAVGTFANLPFLIESTTPLLLAYTALRLNQIINAHSIHLGKFSTLKKDTSIMPTKTPLGLLKFGEKVGSLHLMGNLRKMGEMTEEQRAINLYTDGLGALVKIIEKIENKDPKVKDIKAFKAESHIVGDHPELFQTLGFVTENKPQSKIKKFLSAASGNLIFMPALGIGGLLKGRGFQGFKEVGKINFGNSKTAWTTPRRLLEHKQMITLLHKRFNRNSLSQAA